MISLTVVGEDRTYEVVLTQVLHVPDMDSNLISTTTLLGKGLEVSMHPVKGVNILKDGEIIARTIAPGRLYHLYTIEDKSFAHKAKAKQPAPPKLIAYDIWHRRLTHLGKDNFLKLPKLATGITVNESSIPKEQNSCEPCIQGKQHRNIVKEPVDQKTNPGDLIHSDLCGPITPVSLGEAIYFATFTDNTTRMVFWYSLKIKTAAELCKRFLEFKNEFEQDG